MQKDFVQKKNLDNFCRALKASRRSFKSFKKELSTAQTPKRKFTSYATGENIFRWKEMEKNLLLDIAKEMQQEQKCLVVVIKSYSQRETENTRRTSLKNKFMTVRRILALSASSSF